MVTSSPTPEQILIIRPSALGDVCRTVPVLVSLRRAYPSARIDWLVQDGYALAVACHPDLSHVVEFPRRRFGGWWNPEVALEIVRWLRGLGRERYGLVVDCQGLLRSGLFCYATGSPRRIGYANAAELGWLGLNERVRVPREMHTVDRMLALVEHLGVTPVRDMRLYTDAGERDAVAADPRLAGPYAVIAPTSRWSGKRWPAARFAEVARRLLGSEGIDPVERVVIMGGKNERAQCGPLLELCARDNRALDLVGHTSISRLMAVIERSSLVLANDSAVLHIAVGLGRPIVGLYGPTRVDLVGPYGRAGQVVQNVTPADRLEHKNGAAGLRLMERITVEDVMAKVRSLRAAPAVNEGVVVPG